MSAPSPTKRRKTNDAKAVPTMQPSTTTSKVTESSTSPPQSRTEDPEDWTSSSGSDSDGDNDDESDSGSGSITVTTNPPKSSLPSTTIPDTSNNAIHTRLTSFFSQLAQQRANPNTSTSQSIEKIEIDSDSDSGFEDERDGEERRGQYIELDLALGVLSEKGSDDEEEVKVPGREGNERSDGSESDGQDVSKVGLGGLDGLTDIANGGGNQERKGKKKGEKKGKIQEVE